MNREWIQKITDKTKEGRINKILSYIPNYVLQEEEDITNIIVPARERFDKVVVFAHHDVFPGSMGYNDNSTGVVTLLKLQKHVPDNVELVLTDGEEFGGIGCELYLKKCYRDLPRFAINVDVVGLGNKIFYEEYGPKGVIDIGNEPMEYFDHIPFSDSYIIKSFNVPNILVLTGRSQDELIHSIFEAQHRGPKDGDIKCIQEDIMNKVFSTVLNIVERNA